MLKNFTLKQISAFMTVLLMIVGGTIFAASVYINTEVITVRNAWTEFQLVRSEKARLGGQMRAALGYGGLIHNFKNYILRGGDHLYAEINSEVGGVRMVLDQYTLLPLNSTERAALDNIRTAIIAYQNATAVAENMKASGTSVINVDAFIKVNDALALRGLDTLRVEAAPKGNVLNSKAIFISEIQALAGYGGMIHNFKNYVLRGREEYYEKANTNIAKLRAVIESYRKFDLNRGETVALEDVVHMLDAYGAALDTINTMLADGAGPKDIDVEVKVDDLPALRALNLLAHGANLEILDRSRAVDVSLQKIESAEQAVTIIEITFILIIAVLLTWLLRRQIIAPLKLISVNMKRIAVGDYDVSIADPSGNNEISEMTRDLQVLLRNSIRRNEAEQNLAHSNEELNAQLLEVQSLREQADEQAVEAVAMAETLAFATAEAELAKSKAETDEQRTRAIMNTVVDAIITVSSKGIIETFNMGAQTIFGYTPEEMIGRNVSFLMPEPLRSQHDGFIKSFMAGKPAGVVGRTIEQVGQRKSGEHFPIDLSINAMHIGKETSFIGVIKDITERKVAEDEIRRLAMTDSLTGLANRNAFNTRFDEAIAQVKRRDTHLALLMIDLDKFKPVNDQYGHPVGDALLIKVADCLLSTCRETDIVARLGGDEFAVFLTDLEAPEFAYKPAESIIEALSKPLQALDQTVQIGASIGIAFCPGDGSDQETLVVNADNALYAAKEAGRNTYRVHGIKGEPPK